MADVTVKEFPVIEEIATAAANWWADATCRPTGRIDAGLGGVTAAMMVIAGHTTPAPRPDSREVFFSILKAEIVAKLCKSPALQLSTDYGPQSDELCVAAQKAGISGFAFPQKTLMAINWQTPRAVVDIVRGPTTEIYPLPV